MPPEIVALRDQPARLGRRQLGDQALLGVEARPGKRRSAAEENGRALDRRRDPRRRRYRR